jgi:hypothetical protein
VRALPFTLPLTACFAFASGAFAQAAPPPAKPKPPPYSLPWQLRPVVAGNVVRSDTALALYEDPTTGQAGSTVASLLLASYKVTDELAPMVRLGVVSNSPPTGDSAFGFLNPVVGATYAIKPAKPLRLAFFLGAALPLGSGGGDDASPKAAAANAAGMRARSAMDNAMFAVNDFTIFPGVGLAFLHSGFTVQVEATLLQLMRVRGGTQPAMGSPKNPDSSKTNFTTGLHVGYFLFPFLSVGAELRHQRFLSTPRAVALDDDPESTPAIAPQGLRDTTTFAVGPRFHLQLTEKLWLRPGFAFAMALDAPMERAEYKIVQLDLPLAF